MRKEVYFATWLRAFAAIMILLCHLTTFSGSSVLEPLGQFFNIGVEIFIVLSGFLFGAGGGGVQHKSPIQWFIRRLKRIYVPYEMFLLILLLIHLICGSKIVVTDWLLTATGLQGFNGVQGAEQAWYISAILICYLLTPLISFIYEKAQSSSASLRMAALLGLSLVPIALAFSKNDTILVFGSPVVWYSLAYSFGKKYQRTEIDRNCALKAFLLIVIVLAIRIAGKITLDGTIWYDGIIVQYEHAIGAFCILLCFAYFFKEKVPCRVIALISNISFEIYLYHCMFIVGPVVLMGLTGCWVLDSLLITICSVVVAYTMKNTMTRITTIIGRKV